MRVVPFLLAMALVVSAAVAADTPASQPAIVTFSLSPNSDFAISAPKDTCTIDASKQTAEASVDLRWYLAKLPLGYERGKSQWKSEPLVLASDSKTLTADIGTVTQKAVQACGWPRHWLDAKCRWSPGISPYIADQEQNLRFLCTRIAPDTVVAGARLNALSIGRALPDVANIQAKFCVEVFQTKAPDRTTEMAMAEAYVEWRLPITVSLRGRQPGDTLLSFKLDPEAGGKPGSGETTGVDFEGTLTAAGFTTAMLKRSPGYDVVGGFSVASRGGPQAMAGVVASFEQQDDKLKRPLDWRRIGLLGGRVVGSDQAWIIGPAYKIGDRTHLFGGALFGDSDNNTNHSYAFGLAYSIAGALGKATGGGDDKEATTTAATTLKVKIAPGSAEAPGETLMDVQHPLVYIALVPELQGKMKVAGLATPGAGPHRADWFNGTHWLVVDAADGATICGAWGCDGAEPSTQVWCSPDLEGNGEFTDNDRVTLQDVTRTRALANGTLSIAASLYGGAAPVCLTPKTPVALQSGRVYFLLLSLADQSKPASPPAPTTAAPTTAAPTTAAPTTAAPTTAAPTTAATTTAAPTTAATTTAAAPAGGGEPVWLHLAGVDVTALVDCQVKFAFVKDGINYVSEPIASAKGVKLEEGGWCKLGSLKTLPEGCAYRVEVGGRAGTGVIKHGQLEIELK